MGLSRAPMGSENSVNVYRPTESILREEFGLKAWRIAPPDLPLFLLDTCLRVLRRRSMPAGRIFLSQRLRANGFRGPVELERALRAAAREFRRSQGQ